MPALKELENPRAEAHRRGQLDGPHHVDEALGPAQVLHQRDRAERHGDQCGQPGVAAQLRAPGELGAGGQQAGPARDAAQEQVRADLMAPWRGLDHRTPVVRGELGFGDHRHLARTVATTAASCLFLSGVACRPSAPAGAGCRIPRCSSPAPPERHRRRAEHAGRGQAGPLEHAAAGRPCTPADRAAGHRPPVRRATRRSTRCRRRRRARWRRRAALRCAPAACSCGDPFPGLLDQLVVVAELDRRGRAGLGARRYLVFDQAVVAEGAFLGDAGDEFLRRTVRLAAPASHTFRRCGARPRRTGIRPRRCRSRCRRRPAPRPCRTRCGTARPSGRRRGSRRGCSACTRRTTSASGTPGCPAG